MEVVEASAGSSSLLEYLHANEEEEEEALPASLSTSASAAPKPKPKQQSNARAEPPQLRCKRELKGDVLDKIKDIIDLTKSEAKVEQHPESRRTAFAHGVRHRFLRHWLAAVTISRPCSSIGQRGSAAGH